MSERVEARGNCFNYGSKKGLSQEVTMGWELYKEKMLAEKNLGK